ncbi:MAG TPA: hypothetical protein VGX03_08020 [Candidatus Binatia bacterium]|jgi:hypothetical protein|nr:hypothetical protein [Candidatus Binatia bacterium]
MPQYMRRDFHSLVGREVRVGLIGHSLENQKHLCAAQPRFRPRCEEGIALLER